LFGRGGGGRNNNHGDNDPIMQESNGIPEKSDSDRGISEIVLDLQNHRCFLTIGPTFTWAERGKDAR
jgi:hypothetical protein